MYFFALKNVIFAQARVISEKRETVREAQGRQGVYMKVDGSEPKSELGSKIDPSSSKIQELTPARLQQVIFLGSDSSGEWLALTLRALTPDPGGVCITVV